MKIEWKKVTWYSKLLAVILFVLVLLLSFYFGTQYQQIQDNKSSSVQVKTDFVPTQYPH